MASTQDIHQHCRKEHCIPGLVGIGRDEVVAELVDALVASGALKESAATDVMTQILAREEEGTTGIGGGVAMPHARNCTGLDETMICVGLHDTGVDWESTDGDSVHVVFLILSSAPQEYLQVASRVARVARDSVEMRALRRQKTPTKILAFLRESWG